MSDQALRTVARIDDPPVEMGMNPRHRVRRLVGPGDWGATDPFLALMEDWFHRGTFGPHPHRGIETVTYVIDGELQHRDSRGNQGSLGPGDVQWMTAGRGLLHSEAPPEGVEVHSLQLWVNLPAASKMTEPRYQDLAFAEVPVRREPGAEIRVYSGASGGVVSQTRNHVPVTMLRIDLQPGAGIRQELPGGDTAFLVLLDGEGRIGAAASAADVRGGQVAWLTRGGAGQLSEVRAAAAPGHGLSALLFAGRPVNEPVVARGPFVMNTAAEIQQAYEDFRAGRFGDLREP